MCRADIYEGTIGRILRFQGSLILRMHSTFTMINTLYCQNPRHNPAASICLLGLFVKGIHSRNPQSPSLATLNQLIVMWTEATWRD